MTFFLKRSVFFWTNGSNESRDSKAREYLQYVWTIQPASFLIFAALSINYLFHTYKTFGAKKKSGS